jgi:hypothetical protein
LKTKAKSKSDEILNGYRRHRPDLRTLVAIDPSPSTMLRERGQLLVPTARAVAAVMIGVQVRMEYREIRERVSEVLRLIDWALKWRIL